MILIDSFYNNATRKEYLFLQKQIFRGVSGGSAPLQL